MRFDGRTVLVTGAGGGLGREYALLLASLGAHVVVSDNGSAPTDGRGASAAPAEAVVAEIKSAGGNAVPFVEDLTNEAGARGAVEEAISTFGRIDALVHNASFAPLPQDVAEVSTDVLSRMLKVNTFAAFWMVNSAWGHMLDQGGGRVVLTSSASIFGSAASLAYATAKASILGMGRSLAAAGEPHNIRTNVVLPTAATRLTTRLPAAELKWLNANFRASQVAALVGYLCHEECQVNGEFLSATGGRIGRVRLLETLGDIGENSTLEEVQERMPSVMSGVDHFFPTDPRSRSRKIAQLMGFAE